MLRGVRQLSLFALLAACSNSLTPQIAAGSDLSGFETARITINGQEFEVWLARTPTQRAQGFMNATAEQLAPLEDGTPRGMLFVFQAEFFLSFFMRNTFVPLDLAYAAADGTIFETHNLIPLNEDPVVAGQPALFAFEAIDGTFFDHGIVAGAQIVIPPGTLD